MKISIGTKVLVPADKVRPAVDDGWVVLSGQVIGSVAAGHYVVVRLDGVRPLHARTAVTVEPKHLIPEPDGLPEVIINEHGVFDV